MLALLMDIGRKLKAEIQAPVPGAPEAGPLPRGAGGDRTHPIDKQAEDIIISGLRASGRALTVISEEAGVVELNGGGPERVVIDPIDGSRNAVTGFPAFGTSIAVASGPHLRDVHTSYVLNLANGDEFWAELGAGARMNGKACRTQPGGILKTVIFEAHVPGHDVPRVLGLICEARKVRCLGSIALDLAYLSAGAASVFVVPSASRSYDFSGGWLLVREAGGIFTGVDGADLGAVELGLKRTQGLLAAGNAELHAKALSLLSGRAEK